MQKTRETQKRKMLKEALERCKTAREAFQNMSSYTSNDRLVYELKAAEEAFSYICLLVEVV